MPSVTLTWRDRSVLEDGQRIYRSTSPLDLEALPTPIADIAANLTTYTDSTVAANTTYYYAVESYNSLDAKVSYQIMIKTDQDPNFNNVSLLLHFNGTDGSTRFVDNSPRPKTMTSSSATNCAIRTDQYEFLPSSLGKTGATWINNSTAHVDFNLGNTYTVECSIFVNAIGDTQGIFIVGNPASNMHRIQGAINPDGTLLFFIQAGTGQTAFIQTTAAITAATWHKAAFEQNGTAYYIFLDGVLAASGTVTLTITWSNRIYIGTARSGGAALPFNGNIDEFRVTKGVALYTSSYTPSDSPFPNS